MNLTRLCFGPWLGALVLAGGLMGCGDDPGTGGTAGELGQGTFDYECVNSGDLKCSRNDALDEFELGSELGSSGAIPKAVAVGATFGVTYAGTERDGNDELVVTLNAISKEDEIAPTVFSVSQPAEAGFIASTSDGKVVDFIYVTVLEATSIGIWHEQEEVDSLQIAVGDTAQLTVAPRAEAGLFLAGALPYEWEVVRSNSVGIGRLGSNADDELLRNEGDVLVRGLAEGTSEIRLRSGDLVASIEVEVTP